MKSAASRILAEMKSSTEVSLVFSVSTDRTDRKKAGCLWT
jgi:hypothetical protein